MIDPQTLVEMQDEFDASVPMARDESEWRAQAARERAWEIEFRPFKDDDRDYSPDEYADFDSGEVDIND